MTTLASEELATPSEYVILLQLSSYQHARGGPWNSLRLMSLDDGRRDLSRSLFQAILMLGILLIVALILTRPLRASARR